MNIIVGVTGSIAAYKAALLVSKLKQDGNDIKVIMTNSATRLIGSATFKALSGNPVQIEMFSSEGDSVPHIKLSDWMDVLVICPATANIIGKIACGIADDLVSAVVMASNIPVIIAPAMNEKMYNNKIVQKNIETLKKHGYTIVEPETGFLACGYTGKGRLADIAKIIQKIKKSKII